MATRACEQARGGLRQRAEAREGPVAVGALRRPTQSRVEGGQGLADGTELDPVLVPAHVIPRLAVGDTLGSRAWLEVRGRAMEGGHTKHEPADLDE